MATAPSLGPETLPPLANGDHLDQPTFHARYEAMPENCHAELIGGIVHMPSAQKVPSLQGRTSDVTCVAFSPDGKRIGNGCQNQTIKLWDLTAPGLVPEKSQP